MIKRWLFAYRYLLLAFASTLAFLFHYNQTYRQPVEKVLDEFQHQFWEQEKKANKLLTELSSTKFNANKPWLTNAISNRQLNLHVYRNDSLIYWSSNQLPVNRFADIHFPTDGILHLQNGWYFSKTTRKNNLLYCVTFLIKREYVYQNDYLINSFSDALNFPLNATITFESNPDYSIYSLEGKQLFSVVLSNEPVDRSMSGITSIMLLLISTALLLGRAYFLQKRISVKYALVLVSIICCLRFGAYFIDWNVVFPGNMVFDPSLFGLNTIFPTFFDLLLNTLFGSYLLFSLNSIVSQIKRKKSWMNWLLFVLLGIFFYFIVSLSSGLVENSSIPLAIHRLFDLNIYSLFSVIAIGIALFTYFTTVRQTLLHFKSNGTSALKTIGIGALVAFVTFSIEWYLTGKTEWMLLFPVLFIATIEGFQRIKRKANQLTFGIVFLSLFSLEVAYMLAVFNQRKENADKELFADQLSTEQDIVTEVEYASIAKKIQEDQLIQRLISSPFNISYSDIEDGLDRRIFSRYWERYDLNFFLFDSDGKSIILGSEGQKESYETLTKLIREHGVRSEIDSNIYFISDFTEQLSYVIHQPIKGKNGEKAQLFCTLKSKKIPEEIGFPRLLISSQSQVLASLSHFSLAKYHDNRLMSRYGEFTYSSTAFPYTQSAIKSHSTLFWDGYSHYIVRKSNRDLLVLSTKAFNWKDSLTSFSYIFSFYGLLFLPFLLQFRSISLVNRSLNLSVKIQLLLIGLVFMSLLAFTWGSGIFVQKQYTALSSELIQEKLESIEMELGSSLGKEKFLSAADKGNFIESKLKRSSKIFKTDINFYDPSGFLVATSRPRVFNSGLLGEQMNPESMTAFKIGNKSSFSHTEKIGKLSFVSSYLPFYSTNGFLLGYLNLQQFGQQQESEQQLQQFLLSIIHIFLVLLAISIIIALFISNWLTSPLRMLQRNFASVRLGQTNQRIVYLQEDEIGALVKNYNKKLDELEEAARQLTISERESAWRDVAKQVAHEIKNPLTPMKLSVQHLLRTFNPEKEDSKERLIRVLESLIEQIDALSHIADEFSNFAKMPPPDFAEMDLLPVIQNVMAIYQQETNAKIELETDLKETHVLADREQMVRVFNNLIKNAIQAIPSDKNGEIRIRIDAEKENYKIRISDNGIGMEQSQLNRIFVPYFTTKSNGSGLGLAMVKQIVENHNGTITAESAIGTGSCFHLLIPQKNRTTS